jgi:hypothetical protein
VSSATHTGFGPVVRNVPVSAQYVRRPARPSGADTQARRALGGVAVGAVLAFGAVVGGLALHNAGDHTLASGGDQAGPLQGGVTNTAQATGLGSGNDQTISVQKVAPVTHNAPITSAGAGAGGGSATTSHTGVGAGSGAATGGGSGGNGGGNGGRSFGAAGGVSGASGGSSSRAPTTTQPSTPPPPASTTTTAGGGSSTSTPPPSTGTSSGSTGASGGSTGAGTGTKVPPPSNNGGLLGTVTGVLGNVTQPVFSWFG